MPVKTEYLHKVKANMSFVRKKKVTTNITVKTLFMIVFASLMTEQKETFAGSRLSCVLLCKVKNRT